MSGENTDDKFVEINGEKFKADPDNLEEALKDEDDQPIPFEEKEDKETEEEKVERLKKEKEEEDKDPPVRRSAKDQIIKRLQEKRDKSKKKEEEEEDDKDDATEDSKSIKKQIQKSIKPILDQVRGTSDEQELKDVFATYPDAKKMEKKIRKYMEHPAYKDIPIAFIYLGLAKQSIDKADKLAKKKTEADEEAAEDATGGSTKRPVKIADIPDVNNMGKKEFAKLVHSVRTGHFGKK